MAGIDDLTQLANKTSQLSLQSSVCAGCFNCLSNEEIIQTLNQEWHLECFRCSACDVPLTNWYFEKDGLLFCREDYWRKYGEACQDCSQVITGPVMVAGSHKFHPECFRCLACSSFIGDGESYALVERSKLYCGRCYIFQVEEPATKNATSFVRIPHSIRIVEIRPCTSSNGRGITLAVDPIPHHQPELHNTSLRITRLDVCGDLMSLHVGDRILEVNGLPVTEQSLNDIENLIRYSDRVLQLTIEHDPDTRIYRGSISRKGVSAPSCSVLKESDRERLYKKKDEGYLSGSRTSRQLRRGRHSSGKERSSSLSRLLEGYSGNQEECDLSRTKSFREGQKSQRIFRASDLVKGDLLGQGFFGQVFRVTHRESGEIMVLKELYRVDDDAQRNFLNEVAVLRSLHHHNVLSFIGVVYKEKKLHLVTEYISGGTLKELLHDITRVLTWTDRAKLARDIASGMTYLHSMNIIHRDLNSHNCLVREDKSVVVADFGLARIMPHSGNSNATVKMPGSTMASSESGGNTRLYSKTRVSRRCHRKKRYTVVGNPYWMAPEMMKGNKYDEKVDIFSFGIVVCEIIGRVYADPDYLPRSPDFGLNQASFVEKFCSSCPEPLYRMAFLSCDLNPDKRPSFEVLEGWLKGLSLHLSVGVHLPQDVEYEILNFTGRNYSSSESSTPEVLTPEVHRPVCKSASHTLLPIREKLPADPDTSTIEKTSL
ncbi:LIM domain kinase 1 isoform X2 [Rhodnius prolixus]|uniref:LIM domain kinase 1 isoform X2 n=1 Tax=Rhodnius prolixus TaxID=13249 RepID=UPI003D18D9F1